MVRVALSGASGSSLRTTHAPLASHAEKKAAKRWDFSQ
jgi:hypothetical protein